MGAPALEGFSKKRKTAKLPEGCLKFEILALKRKTFTYVDCYSRFIYSILELKNFLKRAFVKVAIIF